MLIETERLIIRPIEPTDELPFAEMASNGSLSDIGFEANCSKWMNKWIIEAMMLSAKDNPFSDYLAYTIVLKGNHTVIGSVGCSYYEDLQKTGITYFIGTKYRHNGYAKEAVNAYASYFLEHYNAKEIIATIREENIASWKTIEQAGFRFIHKKMYKDINDEAQSMYRFYEKKAYVSYAKQNLILYHGSKEVISYPEIRTSRFHKDFYFGFYCTVYFEQAKRWATRFHNTGFINEYTYVPNNELNVLCFPEMTEEWLDFIVSCRLGKSHGYDIVDGPMANDTIFNYVQNFVDGKISREAFWALARFKRPTHQISFHTARALSTLTFKKGYEVCNEK